MTFALSELLPLLAQAAAEGAAGAGQKGDAPEGPGIMGMMPMFVMLAVVFYFTMMRPQMKERKQHQTMLANLKKNDKVMTVGGIVGTVANISNDGGEITVRVDDNTRLKFMRSYIHSVVVDQKDEST